MTVSPTKSARKEKSGLAKDTVERICLIPDLHCNDQDDRAISLAVQINEAFKPDRLIFLGDFLDSGWASSYWQDQWESEGQFQKELDAWDKIKPLFKAPRRQVILGNHEERILKFVRNTAALKAWLPAQTDKLLHIEDLDCPSDGVIELAQGSFLVTHGQYVRRWSAFSAKAEMEKHGISGATGHTHRLAVYYHRDRRGVRSWHECGHLANNPPRYRRISHPGPQNWMQGLVILYVEGNQFHAEAIPITTGYKAILNGRKFQA